MVPASDPRFGHGEIRAFTGLRGCAAVIVMCYHFTLNMPPDTVPLRQFFLNGYLWVDLFFILSGFVMAYSQSSAFVPGQFFRAHLAFLLSRIARIYPLYLLVLIESACLLAWRTSHLDIHDFSRTFLLNIVMVQAWGFARSMEGAAWSISTEWGAYLLFPFLFALTVLASRRLAAVTAIVAMVTISYLAMSPGPFTLPEESRGGPLDLYSSATAAPLFRCLAEFALGLLAFRLARVAASRAEASHAEASHASASHASANHGRAWTGLIASGVMAVILLAMCWPGLDAFIVALFAILLIVLAHQTGFLARVLGTGVPYALGQWSYSIYLLHDKFSHPAGLLRASLAGHVPFASVIAMVLTICAVIACSALTFVCVERPMRRSLNKMIHRRAARGPAVPASAAVTNEGPGFGVMAERAGSP
jgi:peptidoglycan/LPS O-acetylase OafA/YrhL